MIGKATVIALGVFLGSQFPAHAERAKPNIIYINADDLGVMDVGYRSDRYQTPSIDRLVREGMSFTEGYAPAANCAPSRACVFSGQYGPRHGVYTVGDRPRGKSKERKLVQSKTATHLDSDILTIAGALKAGGYRTIHLGKWHLGEDPLEQGFDVNVGGDTSGGVPKGKYYSPFGRGAMSKFDDRYPEGTHRVDVFVGEAVRFLEENREGPFFMHMAFYSVHTALTPVPEFIGKYQGKANVNATYASMIEKMDEGIGRILDALEALGLKENTLVVFTSDNGGICKTSVQAPYRAGKGSYFEGGIRVPLVMRWPGTIRAESECRVPVIGTDFYPSFLEVAGLTVPEGKVLDGTSLMPLLAERGEFPERSLHWHFPIYLQSYGGVEDDSHDVFFRTRPGSALRQGKWKLHEYFEDGRLELYDLEADRGERTNVADRFPEKTQELHQLMKEWRSEMKAPVPTELNPGYDPGHSKPKEGENSR